MITQERLKELLEYDAETGVFTRLTSPCNLVKVGCVCGSPHTGGYLVAWLDGKRYYMHRLAWLYTHGVFPDEQVDHINGDVSDNRLVNLRSVSNKENARNARRPTNNTSGTMGVCWDKQRNKWKAYIWVDDGNKHLGSFTDLADAVDARKSAESLHGFHPNHGRAANG